MRKPSLTAKSKVVNGKIVTTYEWRGHSIEVYDSAITAMLVVELFSDNSLTGAEKSALLPRMIFRDPGKAFECAGENPQELLCDIVWDAYGLDITADNSHSDEHESPIFDFETDAARIKASLLQCYGLNWDDIAHTMSYCDLCALLGTLTESGEETPFKRAIYYRTATPPKPTKHNREERNAFDELRKHYALEKKPSTAESVNNATADMFAAAKRAAQRG